MQKEAAPKSFETQNKILGSVFGRADFSRIFALEWPDFCAD